jgi:AraC-like DNA-binding protein
MPCCFALSAARVPAKKWRTRTDLMDCLRVARERIEGDLASSVTSRELAAGSGLSPSHFVRLFSSTYGESPLALRSRLRMEEARRLLEETDLPVGEVAAEVGCGSLSTFCREFKARHGASPGHFRNPGTNLADLRGGQSTR